MKLKNRIFAFVLVLALCVSMTPFSVFAETVETSFSEAENQTLDDNFDEVMVFGVDIAGLPEDIQDQARKIDRENYEPECFGVCAAYHVKNQEFFLWSIRILAMSETSTTQT